MKQTEAQTNNSGAFRFEVAKKRKERGDLVGALTIYLNAEEEDPKNAEVVAEIAAAYFDMELYDKSIEYWFRYLSLLDNNKAKMRAYSALSACFCMLGDTRSMATYSEMEYALNPKSEQEYDKVLLDYYDYVCDCLGSGYYVSYPEKYIPAKRLLFESDNMIDMGEDAAAAERLALVQKDSEYYCEARTKMIRCLFACGKPDQAEQALEDLIADFPDDSFANMAYGFYLLDLKDKNGAIYHLTKAAYGEFFDEEDYLRVAFNLCLLGRDDDAFYPLERALEINEYYLNAIYLYGVLNYNKNRIDIAREYFKKLYLLTRNAISKYLLELCDERERVALEYSFAVPKEKALSVENRINDLLDGDERKLKKIPEEELEDLIDWSLRFEDRLSMPFYVFLLYFGSAKTRNYLYRKLLTADMPTEFKLCVVERSVLMEYNKKISFSVDNAFIKFQPLPLDIDERFTYIRRAYAFAVARTTPFGFDVRELREATYRVFDILKDNGKMKKIRDHESLGCVIAIYAGFKIKENRFYELLFNTTPERVKNVFDVISDGEDEGSDK